MKSSSALGGSVYVLVMVLAGALSTVLTKMQYGVRSKGTERCVDPADATRTTDVCAFDKPWFNALLTRIGLTLCLVFVRLRRWLQLRHASKIHATRKETSPLLLHDVEDDNETRRLPLRTVNLIAGLAVLDMVQTLLSNVGLLWVSSSVFQMTRGSFVVFSAMISVRFLQLRLVAFHYVSVCIIIVALTLVCWAGVPPQEQEHDQLHSTMDNAPSALNALLGLALIILSQAVAAVLIVSEEYVMDVHRVGPILLAGGEGLWGLVFFIVLIPMLTLGSSSSSDQAMAKIWHEDFGDTMAKLSHSPAQIWLSVASVAAFAVFGATVNAVTQFHSGVVCSIAQQLRILGVWLSGLFLFYIVGWRGADSPGEAWTVYSWIQLVGFVMMVYGSLTYEKIIRLPWRQLYPKGY